MFISSWLFSIIFKNSLSEIQHAADFYDSQVISNDCNTKQVMGYHLTVPAVTAAIILLPFSLPANLSCLPFFPSIHRFASLSFLFPVPEMNYDP